MFSIVRSSIIKHQEFGQNDFGIYIKIRQNIQTISRTVLETTYSFLLQELKNNKLKYE